MRLSEKLGLRSIKAAIECRLPTSVYGRLFRRRFVSDTVVDIRKIGTFEMEAFPDSGPVPWLDRPDAAQEIESRLKAGKIKSKTAEQYRQWHSQGFLILDRLINPQELDAIWSAYERAINEQRVVLPTEETSDDDPYPGRALSPHLSVPEIAALLNDPKICNWVRDLTGREPVPYQTIASFKGSEQRVHSDSVHMTTYPPS